MKRQYIAFSANGSHNSGLKHTIADARKWAEDFLGKNHANVYICETVAVASRAPTPTIVTDIPKDDFDADKIVEKDVQKDFATKIRENNLLEHAADAIKGSLTPPFIKSTSALR